MKRCDTNEEGNLKSQISNLKYAAIALFLTGCTVGPDYQAPQASMPQTWIGPTSAPSTQQSVTVNQPAEVAQWWRVFNDPKLESLITRAVESNLDLLQSESRIRQARASRRIASSSLFPSVDTSGSYRRRGVDDRGTDLFQAGLDASWEIDVFGGTRRNVESAEAEMKFAVEDRRDVLITLVSEVAFTYIDLRGFQREIEISNRNLAAQRHSANLTRQRAGAGFVSRLDTVNAEASVATTESQIPSLEQAVRQSIYSLSVLLGLPPAALLEELTATTPIPTAPLQVPVGLPSELLLRRPDIRRAEARLHSDTAQIGVATADLFPRFSLTGSLGTSSDRLRGLASWSNATWSIGPGVTWNIFDAGRIRANIDVQNEFQKQSLLGYQRSVLTALQDVENSLIAFEKEQQRRQSLAAAVDANRRALEISTQLYTQGETNFLDVLNAQRSLFVTEDALVQSDRTIATNLVSLYKALGGGWEEDEQTQK